MATKSCSFRRRGRSFSSPGEQVNQANPHAIANANASRLAEARLASPARIRPSHSRKALQKENMRSLAVCLALCALFAGKVQILNFG